MQLQSLGSAQPAITVRRVSGQHGHKEAWGAVSKPAKWHSADMSAHLNCCHDTASKAVHATTQQLPVLLQVSWTGGRATLGR